MITAAPGTPADPPFDGTVQSMQLRVWLDADAAWRATLVLPDARVHEFSSPFALARHLAGLMRPAQPGRRDDAAGPGGAGLR